MGPIVTLVPVSGSPTSIEVALATTLLTNVAPQGCGIGSYGVIHPFADQAVARDTVAEGQLTE
jgi:hypothetical protein